MKTQDIRNREKLLNHEKRIKDLEAGGGGIAELPDNLVYMDEEGEEVQLLGIVDLVYPVGSIYMSVNSVSPATLFGGTWEQIGQGRTLFGAGNGYTAGSTVEAGLPNIEGSFTGRPNTGGGNTWPGSLTSTTSGAFSFTLHGGTAQHAGAAESGTQSVEDLVTFNAANSNPIYGNSETVQPPAFVVYMWKRVA